MVRLGCFLGLLALVLIFGCAAVCSVGPVGETAKSLSDGEWDGTWICQDHAIMMKVLEPQKGFLQIAWLEEKEGSFKVESYRVEIRESGDWLLGNIKEKEGSSRYYWALIKKDKGQMIVWFPDASEFAKLVQAGALSGKVEKDGRVILEKFTAEDLKSVLSGDKGVCFEWKRPTTLFRVGK